MELHYLSATEALKKFKNKTLSPLELTKAVIDRAEKINPKTNAHNFTFYEKAIKSAKKSEEKYSSNKKLSLLKESQLLSKMKKTLQVNQIQMVL